jgi:hypothetical protein
MNRFIIILSLAMAQGMALGAGMPTPTAPKVLPNNPMNRLTIRLRQQNIQIQREVKAGEQRGQAFSIYFTKMGAGLKCPYAPTQTYPL